MQQQNSLEQGINFGRERLRRDSCVNPSGIPATLSRGDTITWKVALSVSSSRIRTSTGPVTDARLACAPAVNLIPHTISELSAAIGACKSSCMCR